MTTEVKPALAMSTAQARAVFAAMCAMVEAGGRVLTLEIADTSLPDEPYNGIGVYSNQDTGYGFLVSMAYAPDENYATKEDFAAAYGLGTPMRVEDLSNVDKSILLYAESCAVDYGGLMAGARMNADDHESLEKFEKAGILRHGRIPFKTIETLAHQSAAAKFTHWVTFNDAAWALVAELRKQRAATSPSNNRKKVDAALSERDMA